ncbi:MAG: glutamine--fructose-6-phosphate transaminase (isomerizing) [SAR324 cluster bacterium]|nr:glutamine--fructose-6-phosphate transaminase (isomerizing) [SAR324 cluster bacterium]
MCGISGIVSSENIAKDLLNSLRCLEYRGYDSCGLAVLKDKKIIVRKNIGTVDEVNAKERLTHLMGNIGIGHTRWATHGGVTKENSHPHLSMNNQFAIVHNGIFSNYQELKEELVDKGVKFLSLTDSEVFAHLIEHAYEVCQDVEKAFIAALQRVEGSYGVAVLSYHEPQYIFCAKKDSPLILGLGEGRNFIASDINGFLEYTNKAITLDDDDYAIVSKDKYWIKNIATGQKVRKKPFTIEWDVETTKKGGYRHYMLKEIFDQPHTAKQALKIERSRIQGLAQMIQQSQNCYLVGVGTTYYVAIVGQYLFAQFLHRHVPVISSDEFHQTAILSENDMLLAISQSGETYDTKMAINYAQSFDAKTAAIVNVMGSSISMMVDQVIMQGSGPEICVVSTKAAFSQMLILLRVVIEVARVQKYITDDEYTVFYENLNDFPTILEATLNEQSGFVRNIAREAIHVHNWLFLGCGVYFPIAMESALKMKEVSYMHAEGMPAGFLKHGTLAMIDDKINTVVFVPPPDQKELYGRTLVAIEEVKARGGTVFGFTFDEDKKSEQLLDRMICLPKVHYLVAPLLEMVMAQLFSYYVALDLGRNIDKPRNLAKSVTVA